jgi:pimeloyl-[acyl-carrier protein] methyl ester esterase
MTEHSESIVWLHGWSVTKDIWQDLLAEMNLTERSICLNLPGHGDEPVINADIKAWAEALLEKMPEQFTLVGWSLGGLIALWIAQNYPQRVKKLLLVAASPRFTVDDDWPCAVEEDVFVEFSAMAWESPMVALKHFAALQASGDKRPKAVKKAIDALIRGTEFRRKTLIAGLTLLKKVDLRDALVTIQCPCMMLLGENDALIKSELATHIPEINPAIQVSIIPDAGHVPFVSKPKMFAQLTQSFLSDEI